MGSPSIDHVTCRQDTKGGGRLEGFSLLEMMLVVTLILIVASIATPIYRTAVERAREAVLRDHLYPSADGRALIDEFTLDNGRAPLRLEELVEKNYLGRLPTDPFTGSEVGNREQGIGNRKQTSLGIEDVHSGSDDLSLEGTPYSSWETRIQDSGVAPTSLVEVRGAPAIEQSGSFRQHGVLVDRTGPELCSAPAPVNEIQFKRILKA